MTSQPTDDKPGEGNLYVITLSTASLPMMLRVPFVHELEGFSVFRSRTIEDGRERYRLYLGYFDSPARAHEALTVVRKHYPSAWISAAPRYNLGSLDDTMNTAFRTIRRATARVVAPRGEPAAAGSASTPALSAEQPPQRYVVQLDCSLVPLASTAIPQLAILRAYHLYRARFTRGERAWHALRLGFFKDVNGALQVADYLRDHFPRAEVLPVSDREVTRAIELMESSGAATRAPEPEKPAAASPARSATLVTTATPVSPPAAAASASPAAPAAPGTTREQLIAKLGGDELSLDPRTRGRVTPNSDPSDVPPRPIRP